MMLSDMCPQPQVAPENGRAAFLTAVILGIAVAVAGVTVVPAPWAVILNLAPVLIVCRSGSRAGILFVVALVVSADFFLAYRTDGIPLPLLISVVVTYISSSLWLSEAFRHRKTRAQLEEQSRKLRGCGEQLNRLLCASPAAVLAVNGRGEISIANDPARDMFGDPLLEGKKVDAYLPGIRHQTPPVRMLAECAARRNGGLSFSAYVWISDPTSSPEGFTAVVVDASPQVPESGDGGLRQLTQASALAMGSLLYEIRNLCAGLQDFTSSLERSPDIKYSEQLDGIDVLVKALATTVGSRTRPVKETTGYTSVASLRGVLENFRLVVRPQTEFVDVGIPLFEDEEPLLVHADHDSLLQILLNFTRLVIASTEASGKKKLSISVSVRKRLVEICVESPGSLLIDPGSLFDPPQAGPEENRPTLFTSRELARSFGGEVVYRPGPGVCRFSVELEPIDLKQLLEPASSALVPGS